MLFLCAVVVAAYFLESNFTPDPYLEIKMLKAEQDLRTIAGTIAKYNSLENMKLKELNDLRGRYITDLDNMKDPWKRRYKINSTSEIVFSSGQDGIDGNADDIVFSYKTLKKVSGSLYDKYRMIKSR